jgi:ferredoxin-NADP reductase
MAGTALLGRLSWRLATVVETVVETPRTTSLILDVPGWPGHRAGQHIDLRLTAEDGYQAQRSYSIASAPEEARLTLTVDRLPDGEVSPYLVDEVRVGDQLELRGPIGGYFTWDQDDGGPLQLIAGGSGIAPLMAMLRHRAARGSHVPSRLLYSARLADEVIYRRELDALSASEGALAVSYTLTRSQPPGWTGYRRRIDQAMVAEAAWAPAERPLIYVCGPTPMVEATAAACVDLGHAAERVLTERFGATGGG